MNTYTKSDRENTVFRCLRHYGSALYSSMAESLCRIVKRIVRRGAAADINSGAKNIPDWKDLGIVL